MYFITHCAKASKDIKKESKALNLGWVVRVEVVETSSQVWKTCILTAVLYSRHGVGYRN